jgi:hypothetical protein
MLGIEYGHHKAVELEESRRALEDKLCRPVWRNTFYGPKLVRVTGILCEDGKRRTATVRGEPDTFFTQPAYVRVAGRTVSGFITTRYDGALGGDRRMFLSYKYGRNGWLLDYDTYPALREEHEQLIVDNHVQENCPKCGAVLYFMGGYAQCCGWSWPCARFREAYGPYGPNADVQTLEDIYEWLKQREVEVKAEDDACQANAIAIPASGPKAGKAIGTMRRILSALRSAVTNISRAAINA